MIAETLAHEYVWFNPTFIEDGFGTGNPHHTTPQHAAMNLGGSKHFMDPKAGNLFLRVPYSCAAEENFHPSLSWAERYQHLIPAYRDHNSTLSQEPAIY